MDNYSILRTFADSWGLLALVIVYFAAILWAFRPGSRKTHADIADIPLRNERPVGAEDGE